MAREAHHSLNAGLLGQRRINRLELRIRLASCTLPPTRMRCGTTAFSSFFTGGGGGRGGTAPKRRQGYRRARRRELRRRLHLPRRRTGRGRRKLVFLNMAICLGILGRHQLAGVKLARNDLDDLGRRRAAEAAAAAAAAAGPLRNSSAELSAACRYKSAESESRPRSQTTARRKTRTPSRSYSFSRCSQNFVQTCLTSFRNLPS